MKTLALLAALLLLALQAQAQSPEEKNEEAPDQEQPGEEDQEVDISFAGPPASALQKAGQLKNLKCHCTRRSCTSPHRNSGSCFWKSKVYTLCCRRRW